MTEQTKRDTHPKETTPISAHLSMVFWAPPRALLPLLYSISCAGGVVLEGLLSDSSRNPPLFVLILTLLWEQE